MKIPHAIAELISEFSGLNKTPDFKAVRSMPNCQCAAGSGCQGHSRPASGTSTPVRKHSGERRHSVIITVGADKLPTVAPQLSSRKSLNPDVKFRKNRRQSAPCISNFASSTSLKEKLSKLRSANSSGDEDDIQEEDEDFHVASRKQSVTSYRVA